MMETDFITSLRTADIGGDRRLLRARPGTSDTSTTQYLPALGKMQYDATVRLQFEQYDQEASMCADTLLAECMPQLSGLMSSGYMMQYDPTVPANLFSNGEDSDDDESALLNVVDDSEPDSLFHVGADGTVTLDLASLRANSDGGGRQPATVTTNQVAAITAGSNNLDSFSVESLFSLGEDFKMPESESAFSNLDLDDNIHPSLFEDGIAANDMGSLLAQFEEAAANLTDIDPLLQESDEETPDEHPDEQETMPVASSNHDVPNDSEVMRLLMTKNPVTATSRRVVAPSKTLPPRNTATPAAVAAATMPKSTVPSKAPPTLPSKSSAPIKTTKPLPKSATSKGHTAQQTKTPSPEILQKIRDSNKRKSTIMLPTVMPTKSESRGRLAAPSPAATPSITTHRMLRGVKLEQAVPSLQLKPLHVVTGCRRGSATSNSAPCSPKMNTRPLAPYSAPTSPVYSAPPAAASLLATPKPGLTRNSYSETDMKSLVLQKAAAKVEVVEVSSDYFTVIVDHDYCLNSYQPLPVNAQAGSPSAQNKLVQAVLPPAQNKLVQAILPPSQNKPANAVLPPQNKLAPAVLPPAQNKLAQAVLPPSQNKLAQATLPPSQNKLAPAVLPPAQNKLAQAVLMPSQNKLAQAVLPPSQNKLAQAVLPPSQNKLAQAVLPPSQNKLAQAVLPPAQNKLGVHASTSSRPEEDGSVLKSLLLNKNLATELKRQAAAERVRQVRKVSVNLDIIDMDIDDQDTPPTPVPFTKLEKEEDKNLGDAHVIGGIAVGMPLPPLPPLDQLPKDHELRALGGSNGSSDSNDSVRPVNDMNVILNKVKRMCDKREQAASPSKEEVDEMNDLLNGVTTTRARHKKHEWTHHSKNRHSSAARRPVNKMNAVLNNVAHLPMKPDRSHSSSSRHERPLHKSSHEISAISERLNRITRKHREERRHHPTHIKDERTKFNEMNAILNQMKPVYSSKREESSKDPLSLGHVGAEGHGSLGRISRIPRKQEHSAAPLTVIRSNAASPVTTTAAISDANVLPPKMARIPRKQPERTPSPIKLPSEDSASFNKQPEAIPSPTELERLPSPFKQAHVLSQLQQPECITSPRQQAERVPSPKQQPERVPSPRQQTERVPSLRQPERVPSTRQQAERVPSPRQHTERVPSPRQHTERVPSPRQQTEQVPSPRQQPERVPSPRQQTEQVLSLRQPEQVPSPRQPEHIQSPSQQPEHIPSPTQQPERVPSPRQQQEQVPSPSQQEPVPSTPDLPQRIPAPSREPASVPAPVNESTESEAPQLTKMPEVSEAQPVSNEQPVTKSVLSGTDLVAVVTKMKRIYRKRQYSLSPHEDKGALFDKLPNYCTTLSKTSKPDKSKVESLALSSAVPTHDRDPSPGRDVGFSKLPSYLCFTNSTKYDQDDVRLQPVGENTNQRIVATEEPEPVRFDKTPMHSAPSSRSGTPTLYIASRANSESRPTSRAPSRPSSRSSSCSSLHKSGSRSETSSREASRSPSPRRARSRGRSVRRRPYRRKRRSYSSSYSSSESRSRSRSRLRYRLKRRSSYRSSSDSRSRSPRSRRDRKFRGERSRSSFSRRSRSRSRSREYEEDRALKEKIKRKRIEERRIVYVGRIPGNFTRRDLRMQFERFGEIEDVSVHLREQGGDNYGFVTFIYTCAAYTAIEKANKISGMERYDLCFGGRREFCKAEYADLDGNMEMEEEMAPLMAPPPASANMDFDELLRQARTKIKKQKSGTAQRPTDAGSAH